MSTRPYCWRMTFRARAAFTLVELLVAIVLIDVGLLALVSSGALVVRRGNELRLRDEANRAAANRLQLLVAGRCEIESGTAFVAQGMTERWSSTVRPDRLRELSDSVVFSLAGVQRQVVL